MPQLTVQFSTTNGFLSRAIRLLTRSEWSHVEFYFPNRAALEKFCPALENLDEVTQVESKQYPAGEGSVLVGAISEGFVVHGPWTYARMLRFNVELTPAQYRKASRRMAALLGHKYWWRGLLNWFLGDDSWKQEKGKVFCSDAVALVFEHAGKPLVNPLVRCPRLTPENVYMSPLLQPAEAKRKVA